MHGTELSVITRKTPSLPSRNLWAVGEMVMAKDTYNTEKQRWDVRVHGKATEPALWGWSRLVGGETSQAKA